MTIVPTLFSNLYQRRWVTMFSQTGTEIIDIVNSTNLIPDLIITNQKDFSKVKSEIFGLKTPLLRVANVDYTSIKQFLKESDIVSLNGYLIIIPERLCSEHIIFNGHPGLITQYPDLVGKDPQENAYSKGYLHIGSVLHRCTAELDGGPILIESTRVLDSLPDKGIYYDHLRQLSLNNWTKFFKEELWRSYC